MVRHAELARLVDDPKSEYYMPNDAAKRSVLNDRDEYTAEGVFWIPEGHRWQNLRKAGYQGQHRDPSRQSDGGDREGEHEPEGCAAEELHPAS
jgi:hypothetical protein